VKDFAPYAAKIKASGADAVITGNWGNDLTLLVKAAREAGFDGRFYTFYGNALGAPAAIGEAGVGRVVAVADWLPNVPAAQSEAFYQSFRKRFPIPQPTTTCTCAAADDRGAGAGDREGGHTGGAAAARWRWSRPRLLRPERRACARPTTSSSSRWWSA
jgi:ABC-type branched-subunit amino acid transport system substrate-binding protein